jgi:hypothetical protein
MATFYVTQFDKMANVDFGPAIPSGQYPPVVTTQTLAIGATAEKLVLNAKTRILRIHTDAICHFCISNNGQPATSGHDRMIAGQTEFPGITNQGTITISVIQGS